MRISLGLLLAVSVAACSPSANVSPFAFGHTGGVYTTGNLRMVTERERALPRREGELPRSLPTLCSEPSPDYAIAFNQSAKLDAAIEGKGGGSIDEKSSEKALMLAGRTAGVLGLRDGLYAACQNYVNGVIGHDAYALILSQYGRQLVELMHSGATSVTETSKLADAKGKVAAMSALLVSCISEHDQTRIGGEIEGPKNPLLDKGFCRDVLRTNAAFATGAR